MSSTSRTCPDREALRALSLGLLPTEALQAVAEHVEQCAACEATLSDFDRAGSDDGLIRGLRSPPAAAAAGSDGPPPGLEPWLRDLLARVQALPDGMAGGPPSADHAPLVPATHADGLDAQPPDGGLGPGAVLRDYRLLEKLGQGGMGAVYKALHVRLDKVVALKVLPPWRTRDASAVRRFEREMKAVGRLEHPHIVAALDAGEFAGTHFLVMEFVDGPDLARVAAAAGPLPIPEACEAIRQAALGLDHAFQCGMVHRDIKPSNLLLSRAGLVKLADLGLARLHAAPDAGASLDTELTITGQVMGTADYMAPEQGRSANEADVRADVYSLGCALYRLLAGRPPFGGPEFDTAIKKVIAHATEPAPPMREARPDVPDALAALVGRMLAKDPADRPQTPGEVADALEPFAAGADLGELARSTAQVAGSAGSKTPSARASSARRTTQRAAGADAHRARPAATARQATARPSTPAVGARPAARRFTRRDVAFAVPAVLLLGGTAFGPALLRRFRGRATTPPPTLPSTQVPGAWLPGPADGAMPGVVARPSVLPGVFRWQVDGKSPRGPWRAAAYSPDGRWLAVPSLDGHVRLFDGASRQLARVLTGHRAAVHVVAWSPDGRWLASGAWDSAVRLWDVASDRPGPVLNGHTGCPLALAWSPDGRWLASGGRDARVRLWRPSGAAGPVMDHAAAVESLAWRPDGQLLASAGGHNTVRLFRPDGGYAKNWLTHGDGVTALQAVAWSPEGDLLASGGFGKTVAVFDGQTLGGGFSFAAPGPNVRSLAWAPAGRTLAVGCTDGTLATYRFAPPGQTPATGPVTVPSTAPAPKGPAALPGPVATWTASQPEEVCAVAWPARDGRTLLTAGTNSGTLRRWRVGERLDDAIAWGDLSTISSIDLRPGDGSSAATSASGRIDVWDAEGNRLHGGATSAVWRLAWNPAGDRLALVANKGPAYVIDAASGRVQFAAKQSMTAAAWHPDGRLMSAAARDRTVWAWTPDGSGTPLLDAQPDEVSAMAWSPDGNLLALGLHQAAKVIRIWDARARTFRPDLGHDGRVMSVRWSGDGRWLASASVDRTARLWRVDPAPAGGVTAGPVLHSPEQVPDIAWGPGDRLVVTAGSDNVCRVWDADSGSLLRVLRGHTAVVWGVAWDAVRNRILSCSADGTVRTWDGDSGEPLQTRVLLPGRQAAVFSAAGERVYATARAAEQLVYLVERAPGAQVELLNTEAFEALSTGDGPPASRATAAPAATTGPAELHGWGRPTDPEGDCRFTADGADRLRIDVPPGYHDLSPPQEGVNGPRVLRGVDGDFRATVGVRGAVRAEPGPSLRPWSGPFRAASLLAWADELNFVRLDRASTVFEDGVVRATCFCQVFRGGQVAFVRNVAVDADRPIELRLERCGGQVTASYSQDGGRAWTAFPASDVAWLPTRLSAGVAAINVSERPFTAEFERFEVSAAPPR